jgi:hypothetical protein
MFRGGVLRMLGTNETRDAGVNARLFEGKKESVTMRRFNSPNIFRSLGTRRRREPNIMRMRGPVKIYREISVAVGLALSQVAAAAPPDRRDPALAPWFESLRQPGTGAPCCSIADCRTVEFRHDRDGYEVFIDGRWKMSVPFWLRVPPERTIDRIDNPTGRAVVCFTPEAGIICFVPPPES